MRFASLRAVAVGCAVAASGIAVAQSRAHVVDATTIAFRVVRPDGSAVANPVIMVSVLGPNYAFPSVRTGGALGEVVVPMPTEDPYVAERIAAGEAVNLLIRVFDRMPVQGSNPNAAYIAAAIDASVDGVLRASSSAANTAVVLHADRADYRPVGPGEVVGAVLDGETPEECPAPNTTPDNKPVVCKTVEYPGWAQHVMVPVAYNHGAGDEMYSEMRYRSTIVTKLGLAVQAGKPGFFVADGSVDFEKERSDAFGWTRRGPNANVKALLETVYKRTRAGSCFNSPVTGWQCQVETVYSPYQAVGNASETASEANDMYEEYGPYLNAWKQVEHDYESTEASMVSESYSFTLGPDENWAVTDGGMYANTTVTQQTHTKKGFVRTWKVVDGAARHFHYMWVPFGNYDAVRSHRPGGGEWVDTHVGDAWTWATDVNLREGEPMAQPDPLPVPAPTPPDEHEPSHQVCGRMPDRCD